MNSSDRSNHPINVFEMMERLGIEGGGGVLPGLGLAYASALRTCHQCERGEACHEWLKVMSTMLRSPPKFCPNADLFCQLTFEQPSAWAAPIACTRVLHRFGAGREPDSIR